MKNVTASVETHQTLYPISMKTTAIGMVLHCKTLHDQIQKGHLKYDFVVFRYYVPKFRAIDITVAIFITIYLTPP